MTHVVLQRIWTTVLTATLLALFAGCASQRTTGPYNAPTETSRNPLQAQRLTQQAAALMQSDPEQAERLLREALTHDLYHGPAHNNLGVLYLQRGELYEAANEFEWARKLMPGHPDPRLNLALTLEKAGRVDEAIAACNSALEVYPGHIATIQELARLQLKNKRTDSRTHDLLEDIAMRGTSPEWMQWAELKLQSIDR